MKTRDEVLNSPNLIFREGYANTEKVFYCLHCNNKHLILDLGCHLSV